MTGDDFEVLAAGMAVIVQDAGAQTDEPETERLALPGPPTSVQAFLGPADADQAVPAQAVPPKLPMTQRASSRSWSKFRVVDKNLRGRHFEEQVPRLL